MLLLLSAPARIFFSPSVRGVTVSYVMRFGVLTATPRSAWRPALFQQVFEKLQCFRILALTEIHDGHLAKIH